MEWIIAAAAFGASLLTLFSGFGLGTLLTPVFGLFFPIHLAVALTGIVHLLNNLFKISLLGKNADRGMVLRFGALSILGGLAGAWLLALLSRQEALITWYWGQRAMEVTWLKLFMAALMIFFALMEIVPRLRDIEFDRKYLPVGGVLSGFFGGLSGHQGALRSAFLMRCGLTKEQFIATGVAIACLVDLTRLPVYFSRFESAQLTAHWRLLLIATLAAFAGAWLGARYLKKVTLRAVRNLTATLIISVALLLGAGAI